MPSGEVAMASSSAAANDWVAFERSDGFQPGASARRRSGSNTNSSNRRSRSRSRRRREYDPPLRADASWVPMPAPQNSHNASRPPSPPPPATSAALGRLQPVNPPNRQASSPRRGRRLLESERNSRAASNDGGGVPMTTITTTTATRSLSSPRRSRSRSRHRSKSNRPHSRSRSSPRATTTSEVAPSSKSVGAPRRGRTSSRPPPTRVPTERARSRSASLTRVTSPRATTTTIVLNSPSAKSTKSHNRKPPTTSRTRQELRAYRRKSSNHLPGSNGSNHQHNNHESNSIGPGLPHPSGPRSVNCDSKIGREFSFQDLTASLSGSDSSNSKHNRKTGGTSSAQQRHPQQQQNQQQKVSFRERLFGTQGDGTGKNGASGLMGLRDSLEIRPRILLAATVYHNTATNLWITTINTNQRGVAKNPKLANKYLKAFSFSTEQEARESAIANAPPKMVPFNDSPSCFVCHSTFAVFKRASHCRNCGVAICSQCTNTWPAKCLPETYNLKNEANLKVCSTCDTLSAGFRRALLQGEYEEAIAIYGTGNINLRTPFAANKKEEVIYPIHAAVDGGNLKLLRWLVEDHFCPLQVTRTSKKTAGATPTSNAAAAPRDSSDPAALMLIATSKGRTALSLALERARVHILQYLVVERGVSVFAESGTTNLEHTLRSLEATLVALPKSEPHSRHLHQPSSSMANARWDDQAYFDDNISEPSSLGAAGASATGNNANDDSMTLDSRRSSASRRQRCVICMDRKINCVATPCGHQVSCLTCSGPLEKCPICNRPAAFIKIFRP